MATLAKVLPLCRNLEYLNLKGSHNGYTAESATVLADVLSREPKVLPNLVMIGAGCRAKDDEAGQGPLLESEQLKRACESRGVELLRDVPFELVQAPVHAFVGGPQQRLDQATAPLERVHLALSLAYVKTGVLAVRASKQFLH